MLFAATAPPLIAPADIVPEADIAPPYTNPAVIEVPVKEGAEITEVACLTKFNN